MSLALAALPSCFCVAASTPVRTPAGEVLAGSLAVGDPVCSIDLASGLVIVGRVVQLRRAVRECLALRWDGGALVCTPDHPLLDAERGIYRPASDFVTGDARRLLAWTEAGTRAVTVTVVDRYVGLHEVLDIAVDAAPHNFVAGGVIVHNKSVETTSSVQADGPDFELSVMERAQEFRVKLCSDGADFDLGPGDMDFLYINVSALVGEAAADEGIMRLAVILLADDPESRFVDIAAPGDGGVSPAPTDTPCSVGFALRFERFDDLADGVITVMWGATTGYTSNEGLNLSHDVTLTIEP